MIAVLNGLAAFGDPVLLVGLIAITLAFLEGERVWTRSRRRRGFEPGPVAYLLDGLVLAGVVLGFGGMSTLFIGGLASIGHLLGRVFDGEQVGLLIVGIALALGIVLALARIARGRRAAQDIAPAVAIGAPAAGSVTSVAEPIPAIPLAPQAYQSAAAPMPGQAFEEEPVPSLSMLQGQRQPTARSATNVPTSFLELGQPQSAQRRSRFAFTSSLLTLACVALLVSGAILFRGQLIGQLAGLDDPGGQVAITGNAAGAVQPNATAEQPAANVSSADQSVAPASEAPQAGTKRVKSEELNVRARPGVDQQVVVVLAKGVSVTVLTDARLINDTIWVKVRVGDQEGWVDQSLLE
ncbi:MAG TPA: SH3 domain-containing protein [Roseiflexaceae bacterium]|nr:SH3 domain-containing protein [Roseiflexaceae bacterium]